MARPALSLIVPTRGRPALLGRFLDSLAATTSRPRGLEIVLVVDDDDPESAAARHPALPITVAVGPPGRTMGELNRAGAAASAGEFVMLLNDDVIARTRGWDSAVLAAARRFPDGISLVHVNDTLMRDHLCTFPLVSRTFCDLAGGICPADYRRYRIDDHIEDVFNLLAVLGERRVVYLPDVVFEHTNAVEHPTAGRVYESDPAVLALDAPVFDALFPARKELAVRLMEHVRGRPDPAWRAKLAAVTDPFALRVPGRQRVVRAWWAPARELAAATRARATGCYARGGVGGLLRAAVRRVVGRFPRTRV